MTYVIFFDQSIRLEKAGNLNTLPFPLYCYFSLTKGFKVEEDREMVRWCKFTLYISFEKTQSLFRSLVLPDPEQTKALDL